MEGKQHPHSNQMLTCVSAGFFGISRCHHVFVQTTCGIYEFYPPSIKPPSKIHHASLRWKKITLWVGRDLSQIGVMFGQTFENRNHLQSRPLLVMTRVETPFLGVITPVYRYPFTYIIYYTIYKAIYKGYISLDNITSRGLLCFFLSRTRPEPYLRHSLPDFPLPIASIVPMPSLFLQEQGVLCRSQMTFYQPT